MSHSDMKLMEGEDNKRCLVSSLDYMVQGQIPPLSSLLSATDSLLLPLRSFDYFAGRCFQYDERSASPQLDYHSDSAERAEDALLSLTVVSRSPLPLRYEWDDAADSETDSAAH